MQRCASNKVLWNKSFLWKKIMQRHWGRDQIATMNGQLSTIPSCILGIRTIWIFASSRMHFFKKKNHTSVCTFFFRVLYQLYRNVDNEAKCNFEAPFQRFWLFATNGQNAHYPKYLIIMIVISSLFQTEYSCHQTPFFNSLGGQSSSGSRYDNESRIYEEVFLTSNQEGRTKHTFYGKLHLIHESQNVILDTLQNVLELSTFSAC